MGGVLGAGLGIFLVGAGAWRLEYQRPLPESLPATHRDRRRWACIHVWMVAGVLVTVAGLAGLAVILKRPPPGSSQSWRQWCTWPAGSVGQRRWASASPWCLLGPPDAEHVGRLTGLE